jgi:hypothetical protein
LNSGERKKFVTFSLFEGFGFCGLRSAMQAV